MTASIFNRGTSKRPNWGFSIYLGKDENGKPKRRFQSGFATKREAVDASDIAKAGIKADREAAANPQGPPAVPQTLAEFVPVWIREYAERETAPATSERYGELAEFFMATLGPVLLCDLTPFLIQIETNRLRDSGGKKRGSGDPRPLAAKTVRHIIAVLKLILSKAREWGLIAANPMAEMKLPSVPRKAQRALDYEETHWLLECAKGSWIYPLMVVASATGARRGELCALQWTDIDFEASEMMITKSLEQTDKGLRLKETKSGETRNIPLPLFATDALKAHRTAQQANRDALGATYRLDLNLVFPDEAGDYRKPDSVTGTACRIGVKAGFRGVSLHNLRHGHGSQLLAAGVPLPTVADRLGHATPDITAKVYSHALRADARPAADAWEAAMRKSELTLRTKQ